MEYSEKEIKNLQSDFSLLQSLVRQKAENDIKVDLNRIEQTITKIIPETLQNNAPPNFHVLFSDFKFMYDKFKDFILYDQLIGKNIIALGGGFSSGKSSFLNAIMGKQVLPAKIEPSTSVPTYIVSSYDTEHHMKCINIFDAVVDTDFLTIKKIAHGFGGKENGKEGVTLGHIIESVFFATPLHKYSNIAFLDTPGYSKPDTEEYSKKTDEQIARGQLNTSNLILWFVQADAGTISDNDIRFLQSLKRDIPIAIVLNKADKKVPSELKEIKSKIEETLMLKGVTHQGVFAFSKEKTADMYDREALLKFINSWDKPVKEVNFAYNFRKLFLECKKYYEESIDNEENRLSKLQKAVALVSDDDSLIYLNSLIKEIKSHIIALKNTKDELNEVKNTFFHEIKIIADIVNIAMPEPSEIDLLGEDLKDPLQIIREYKKQHGIKEDKAIYDLISSTLSDIHDNFLKAGSDEYKEEIAALIEKSFDFDKNKIKYEI